MNVRLSDVAVARGGVPVLEGVSLTLAPGQVQVLRGPNGIGKTTLLRAVAGLQPVIAGQIEGAEDRVAYAGHADGLKATLTVRENLRFWAAIYGQSDVDHPLAFYELGNLAERPAQNLSAGQKRRLGLARLLVTGRPVWVLDEPTVSLDTARVAMFADAVRAHCAEGGSALIATHIDLGLDAEVIDLTPFRAKAPVEDLDEVFL